jgi:hypothetical protein
MTEENFEKFLKQTAQGYNAPPARVPRDEMWSAIQAKRSAGPRVVYGGGLTAPGTSAKRFGTKVWLGAAAAAMLLVATGVGIGRWTATPGQQVATKASQPQVVVPAEQGAPTTPNGNVGIVGNPSPTNVASGSTQRDLRAGRSFDRAVAVNDAVGKTPRAGTSGPTVEQGSSSAYQLTTVRYLSDAEALLTSFRSRTTQDQQMDAQLGAWARQLLTNTRLLLDSPVANDPHRRPLLEDLELVLVQIVQLSPGTASQDRELIEKTLQQEHVLTRLRTAIPAGTQRGS